MKPKKGLALCLAVAAVLLIAALLTGSPGRAESVQEAMRDAVLHGTGQISLLHLKNANPGLISALLVTALLLGIAALLRVFVIPRFQYVPGRLQLVIEEAVGLFQRMARTNSPHRNRFLGLYLFTAASYVFVGTLFELLGLQAVTVHGRPITLPAPLSDVNAAIALGCLSYLVILSGGIAGSGARGVGKTLKEFSLPISMSPPQRPFSDGAGVLLHLPELPPACGGGRALHPAPRTDPDLRAHHAHRPLLRGGLRARPAKAKEKSGPIRRAEISRYKLRGFLP